MAMAQQAKLQTQLHPTIDESSGMLNIAGRIITHNDSGGETNLYEVDTVNGDVIREVFIANAKNVDWEALAFDNKYIYIGDIGNNYGDRTDLKIYLVEIAQVLFAPNDTAFAETIEISYADQTDFSNQVYSTNFDAESLVVVDDSLYLLTKNWGDYKTNVYPVPREPGTYALTKVDSMDVQGVITDATYDDQAQRLFLAGYTAGGPFVVGVTNFTPHHFSTGDIFRKTIQIPQGYSWKIEACATLEDDIYNLATETNSGGPAGLYWVSMNVEDAQPTAIESKNKQEIKVYPNPATNEITHTHVAGTIAKIYTLQGKELMSSSDNQIDVSSLAIGSYSVVFHHPSGEIIATQKLVVRR
jgi:hypothetical protein